MRRGITLLPSMAVLFAGVDPTRALVWSQVVLSFGIPFALVPLILQREHRADHLQGQLTQRRPQHLRHPGRHSMAGSSTQGLTRRSHAGGSVVDFGHGHSTPGSRRASCRCPGLRRRPAPGREDSSPKALASRHRGGAGS
ncbi:divalent metal cation transporter [Streptomyces toxytricini]|uniref:divalent metal cation transporter n=1 Tax=Streptomyces toxytricini TaxID=67369 RepID=UPI003422C2AE